MTKQSDVFLQGEGDAWYERNKDKPRPPDPVLDAMEACKIGPKAVLEIGCGNGWRLAEIYKKWGPIVVGYDPSAKAVKESQNIPQASVWQGTALEALSLMVGCYDLVIFGFCLYLVDREDLMMIAAHTDRVLKDGGHIIIHDFLVDEPYKVAYKHKEGVWSYHMRCTRLWIPGNPAYKNIYEVAADEETAISVLKKDMANAYPERKI